MSTVDTRTGTPWSARALRDERLADDVALYDITRQAATVLSSLLLQRMRGAEDDAARAVWAARRRLVKRQVLALDPGDRAGLVAQQEAWAAEIDALESAPSRISA
ncbi:MAG: hypothetical protein LBC97_16745 [Bifidobacteriaceae bacterium]|jgi:hypothetical protein|nr:hypothetical protein [Bifidobacteriaceae bacterium]